MKLRSKLFDKEINKLFEKFNSSIYFDKKLYNEDILCSIAHAKMLSKTNIISASEGKKIINGLKVILKEIELNIIKFNLESEDIHMNIENLLIDRIGNLGKKLHTARSRNDQIATDLKLYAKKEVEKIFILLKDLLKTIISISKKNINTIMPGYTHMQKAQPITFAYHLMAYFEMFKRDYERFSDALKRINISPLGACALAGTSFPIDREYTKNLLGFDSITLNSLDAVSDRDYIVEVENCSALVMVHLSRLCEEIILWNTDEFKFIYIDDAYTTGSSIMPQKKNPDVVELIRGKSGRVFGNLISILTNLKGLPLSYNKDMQEDKEGFFDTIDTVKNSLIIIKLLLSTIIINKKQMEKSSSNSFMVATDIADYLVKNGLTFRDAYHITASIISKCTKEERTLEDLSLDEYKKFSKYFKKDIYNNINLFNCVNRRNSMGGTSQEQVNKHLKLSQKWILKI